MLLDFSAPVCGNVLLSMPKILGVEGVEGVEWVEAGKVIILAAHHKSAETGR